MRRAKVGAFDWSYNDAGLPRTLDYPNGSQANYTYDSANRIKLIDNKQSGVTVTSHAYEYDKNGNREKLTESNIDASQITTYTYDDADRLIQTNYPSYISTLTLDKAGNRKTELIDIIGVLNTRTYDYNQRDQLISVTDTDGLNIIYDYDEAGNQTEKTENGVTTDFNYTARQRVKSITIGGAPPIEYQYDHAGQRVNVQANGTEKRNLYDGLTLIAETNTLGNTLARYHYGQRHQVAETRNGQSAFYLADALGTNVAITNADGSIQNRMNYDVWGNLTLETASSESPFGFTGYIKDEDTELYYVNARYYDSFTGRFLREDPFQGDVNTPPSLHRYLYANGNPTVYIDLDGNVAFLKDLVDHFREAGEAARYLAKESDNAIGSFLFGAAALPTDAAGAAVSLVNNTANVVIVGADDVVNALGGGRSFQGIRQEKAALDNQVMQVANHVVDRNVRLIPDVLKAVGTTVGEAFAGNNEAWFDIGQGAGGALIPGGYLAKTRFKGPDLDAQLEMSDSYLNKPVYIAESSSNELNVNFPVKNQNLTSIFPNKIGSDVPYNSRAIRNELVAKYGADNVISTTIPPLTKPNVKLAGQRHPITGVVFDSKGFPVFDDIARYDTRLNVNDFRNTTYIQQMVMASDDLRKSISKGQVSPSSFNNQQLEEIFSGSSKISGFTWHHHQDTGRMQLVPEFEHSKTGHVGWESMNKGL